MRLKHAPPHRFASALSRTSYATDRDRRRHILLAPPHAHRATPRSDIRSHKASLNGTIDPKTTASCNDLIRKELLRPDDRCCCRTAQKRHELASFYSITSWGRRAGRAAL